MIRHFNIFPHGFDKENLFDEQKVFLMYLIGTIPDIENWKVHIDYKSKLEVIKELKDVKLDQTEIDLANISGTSLTKIQKEKLISEKKMRIQELNKKFGIVEDDEEIEKTVEFKKDLKENNPAQLWELLQGKGLVK